MEVTHNLREAIDGADVIYSLRIQLERQQDGLFPSLREYIRLFRIDTAALAHAKPDALVMHPGPINRDIELSTSVADGPRSVILEQVSNGVAIRMAAMHPLVNSGYRDSTEGRIWRRGMGLQGLEAPDGPKRVA